ncbi:MAG: 50S ribosomal protein L4 [Firmicutes bacterium]|jgi:large subunit ribosomal protein L4|nr:50S ribosomal protein L4 [Bacillota bacterium]NLL87732.1 50S ribosomal protein L4 [Bacillota bacterium]HKM18027.1 50S ribosomal protein L4 [Limnochordia bacterium]
MPKVAVYNMEGVQIGDIELNNAIFGVKINEGLMHQAVLSHLAKRRQGTAATKNRSQVRGGGRKPWRQKGTGRARVGSIRSPLWVGGGVVFGPTPRDYAFNMPKKARRMALKSALSAKVRDGELIVLDELKIDEPKTKLMVKVLKALNADQKPLIVISDWDSNIELATRNIPRALLLKSSGLNVYDVLNHDRVIFTKDALTRLEEVLA